MFDKQRENWKQFTETNETFIQIKTHFESHKTAYIAGASGASCLVAGGIIGLKLGPETSIKPIAKNWMLAGYKSPQTIAQELTLHMPARADRGHIILNAITGLPVGSSIVEAARNEGISQTALRNNTRGLTEFAPNGNKYIDLGENLSETLKIALQ